MVTTQRIAYSPHCLRRIGLYTGHRTQVPLATACSIKTLGIYGRPTKLGTAGRKTKYFPIRTIVTTNRTLPKQQQHPPSMKHVLTPLRQVKPKYDIPTVLLSNTRALTNKIDKLEGVLHSNNVDSAAITETWMSASIPESCTHRRRKIIYKWGGRRNFGETCQRHVACRRHAMIGGSGGMLPRKILNFRCVFLQSGGI